MVTKHQLDKLSLRIEELAEQLGLAVPITYVVRLHFRGESDEEFYARYPDARGRKSGFVLSFGDPQNISPWGHEESANVPRSC